MCSAKSVRPTQNAHGPDQKKGRAKPDHGTKDSWNNNSESPLAAKTCNMPDPNVSTAGYENLIESGQAQRKNIEANVLLIC